MAVVRTHDPNSSYYTIELHKTDPDKGITSRSGPDLYLQY